MNNRGFAQQIWVVIMLGLVMVGIIVLFFAWSLAGPIITQSTGELNTLLQSTATSTGDSGIINASQSTFQPASEGINVLEWLSFFMIIMLFLTMIIIASFVRTYPFLAFVWIFIIVILVFVSIFITVAYQDITSGSGYLADTYASWESSHYILLNLPIIVVAVGIIGGILMFILSTRDREAEVTAL